MSKQKNNEVLKYNEPAFAGAGDYGITLIRLQPVEEKRLNKYGRMCRAFLQEHNPILFDDLVLEGKLWTYLADLNEQTQNRLQLIIRQMQEGESVNDELKKKNQLAWVQAMNSIHTVPKKSSFTNWYTGRMRNENT